MTFVLNGRLSYSVHALLGLDFCVQTTYFVHDSIAVLMAESGRAHCIVQIVPISCLHSAERLLNLVSGLFQMVKSQ